MKKKDTAELINANKNIYYEIMLTFLRDQTKNKIVVIDCEHLVTRKLEAESLKMKYLVN
jgi:hypothetical protein